MAVLLDGGTASSGELTALAFVGRPGARTFGQASAGFTTGNASFELYDGAVLNLAGVVMTDRTGTPYFSGIRPDENVSASGAQGEEDSVLAAATAWLRAQPECAGGRETASPVARTADLPG